MRKLNIEAGSRMHYQPSDWRCPNPIAAPLDSLLLAEYSPDRSVAWPGAAPSSAQLDLWWHGSEPMLEHQAGSRSVFRRRGFAVRPIAGPGSASILDRFCREHHRYLRTRGMSGQGFGMYTPAGELVGVANFAPCSNPRTAKGMQLTTVPEDKHLTPQQRAHLSVSEKEYFDCVRLCVADFTAAGDELGTGAESFLYASCLRAFSGRNRDLWRAIRMAELRLPLPPGARALIAAETPFIKLVRSFADPAEGHVGTIYTAAGAWYLGTTRAEPVWQGRRSGERTTRRSLSKLSASCDGHVNQVLRAAYEGSAASATLITPAGDTLLTVDLKVALSSTPDDDGAALRRKLHARWREIQKQTPVSGRTGCWILSADTGGYEQVRRPPKYLYGTYLGSPFGAANLLRRCRRLRETILSAEHAWKSAAIRAPRGHGYSLPSPPRGLARAAPPRRKGNPAG
jgi:hypothetical protein